MGAARARELAVQRHLRRCLDSRPVQAGLFDRRALRDAATRRKALAALESAGARRLADLAAGTNLRLTGPRLALAWMTTDPR